MPLPWPAELLPYVAVIVPAVAVAGGCIGALIGGSLASDRVRWPRGSALALAFSGLVIVAATGYGLHTAERPGTSATVALKTVQGGPNRTVSARIALHPRGAAGDARWLTITAWQGHGFVLDRLARAGDGVYRTTKPIPVHGKWKTMIRLHRGNSLEAVPIYLPADPAIPATAVPAKASFTRGFVADKKLLQREAKSTAPWLAAAAYLTVLACALALLALLALGLRRLALAGLYAGDSDFAPARARGLAARSALARAASINSASDSRTSSPRSSRSAIAS
jgi:hypothetical protein